MKETWIRSLGWEDPSVAQANGSLDDAMMRRFESLSLSVCYDLLEASAINGSL